MSATIPTPSGVRDDPLQSFVVGLQHRTFVCAWILVVGFHATNAAFLTGAGGLYWYFVTPDMSYFIPLLNLPSIVSLKVFGVLYFILSGAHVFAIFQIVQASVYERRVTFHTTHSQSSSLMARSYKRLDFGKLPRRLDRVSSRVHAAGDVVESWRREAFSIDGRHFQVSFAIREAFEIFMQTYQAYSLSSAVSRTWINNCAVAIIVLNCVSTPLVIQLRLAKRLSRQQTRLLCVGCDMLLDFAGAVIVPLMVFTPYWRRFDPTTHQFDGDIMYHDVWFTNAVAENRQVLITNNLDLVSSILPHISVLLSLRRLKRLLVRQPCTVSPTSLLPDDLSTNLQTSLPPTRLPLARRLLNMWSIVWAAGVVAVHILANTHNVPVETCKLHNSAWFVSKYSCGVVYLDCHRLGTPGNTSELEKTLANLDRWSLSLLAFKHCEALKVPTIISQFPALFGIVMFNTTIQEWSIEASPRRSMHSVLNYLLLVRVNFSDSGELPPAIVHPETPTMLRDIEISVSNLQALPQDMTGWIGLYTLYVEFTSLQVVPDALFTLPELMFVSVAGNNIQYLPDDALLHQSSRLQEVTLSGNPITRLPPSVSAQSFNSITRIDFEHTNILDLPGWVQEWWSRPEKRTLNGFGSSFCTISTPAPWGPTGLREHTCLIDRHSTTGLVPVTPIAAQHTLE